MPSAAEALERLRKKNSSPARRALERFRASRVQVAGPLADNPLAIPTEQIESITGPLPANRLGPEASQDPRARGREMAADQESFRQFGGASLREFAISPVVEGVRTLGRAAAETVVGQGVLPPRSTAWREGIREDYERKRDAYLSANPTKVRHGIVLATSAAANLAPLMPGGALARMTAKGIKAAGVGSRTAQIAGGMAAAGGEGALVGHGDSMLFPEDERGKHVALTMSAAMLLGGLGAARATKGLTHGAPGASDDVSEAFGRKYVQEPSAMGPKGVDRLRAVGRRVHDEMIDEFGPITRLTRKAGPDNLRRMEEHLQQVRASPLTSQIPVFKETRLFDPEVGDYVRTGESLNDIVGDLDGDVFLDAERYLVARRHTLDLASREDLKISDEATEDAQSLIDHMVAKYGVDENDRILQLDDVADRFTSWNERMLQSVRRVGFLSDDDVAQILGKNEHYALFSRARGDKSFLEEVLKQKGLSEDLAAGELRGPGTKGKSSPVRKIHGGLSADNPVEPLFEASATKAMRIQRLVDRQHVRNMVGDLAERVPEIADEVQPVKSRTVPARGREGFSKVPGEGGFATWRDGVRQDYDAAPDLIKALDGLTPREAGVFATMLKAPARILRAGATLTPQFMAKNPLRDQITAGTYSRHGYVPFWDLARTLGEQTWHRVTRGKNAPYWEEFINSGAASSTLVALDRTTLSASLSKAHRLQGGGFRNFGKEFLRNPLYPLQSVSDVLEKATRVGEFARARRGGSTTVSAALDAADVTLNFSRAGRFGRSWNMYESFVNAELQDLSKFSRAMKSRPLATTAKAFAYIMTPAIAEWSMFHDDPDWQQLPEWRRALFFNLKKRDDGSFVGVPKPLGVLGLTAGTLLQHSLDFAKSKLLEDPELGQEAVQAMVEAISDQTPIHFLANVDDGEGRFSTDLLPTGSDVLAEIATNRDLFFDSDIVPKRLQNVDRSEQFTERTGPTAIGLAKTLGVGPLRSPLIMEKLITGMGAGTAKIALDASDSIGRATGLTDRRPPPEEGFPHRVAGFDNPFVSRIPFGPGSWPVSKVYDQSAQASVALKTYKKMLSEGRSAEAAAYREEHPEMELSKVWSGFSSELSKFSAERRDVINNKSLNEEERLERILQIDQAMTATAATMVDVMEFN